MFKQAIWIAFIALGFSSGWLSSGSSSTSSAMAAPGQEEHAVDLTHGFAGKSQTDPLEFRSDMALFTLVVFVLLLAVLYVAAWKPIQQGLALREATIAEQVESAKRASEDAAAKLAEMQSKFESAAKEAQEMVAQARRDAEASGAKIIADAQMEAKRQKDRAIADIHAAKLVALSELGSKSTDLAFGLARGVLGRELRKEDHQGLIHDAMKSISNKN